MDWLDAHEAAAYARLSPSRLRDLARAGELVEDGRGPRGIRMYRRATIDAWFVARLDKLRGPIPPTEPASLREIVEREKARRARR